MKRFAGGGDRCNIEVVGSEPDTCCNLRAYFIFFLSEECGRCVLQKSALVLVFWRHQKLASPPLLSGKHQAFGSHQAFYERHWLEEHELCVPPTKWPRNDEVIWQNSLMKNAFSVKHRVNI